MRYSALFGAKISSVGYCHIDDGCKFAITGTHGSNGIAAAPNGTIYVADSLFGGVLFLERQADNTLVVSESVKTGTRYIAQCTIHIPIFSLGFCPDHALDNIAVDADGQLWAAGMQKGICFFIFFMMDGRVTSIFDCLGSYAQHVAPITF